MDEDGDDDDEEDMEEEEEDEAMGDKEEDSTTSSNPQRPAVPSLPGSIPITDCLFCSHHSKSLMRNVAHMTHVHSFFISDLQYLVDLRGLVRYLGKSQFCSQVNIVVLRTDKWFLKPPKSVSPVDKKFGGSGLS